MHEAHSIRHLLCRYKLSMLLTCAVDVTPFEHADLFA